MQRRPEMPILFRDDDSLVIQFPDGITGVPPEIQTNNSGAARPGSRGPHMDLVLVGRFNQVGRQMANPGLDIYQPDGLEIFGRTPLHPCAEKIGITILEPVGIGRETGVGNGPVERVETELGRIRRRQALDHFRRRIHEPGSGKAELRLMAARQ